MNLEALRLELRHNRSIWVPKTPTVFSSYILLEQEAWFEEEVDFIRHCVGPGERAIDIGANLGVYTLALADAVGPAGKVIAFEPTATTAAYLRASMAIRHSSTVCVEQTALSDREGVAVLHAGVSPELNRLAHSGERQSAGESVRVTTLDHYMAGLIGPRITFLKIDAEGHESNVINGAKSTLREHEPLILFEVKNGDRFDFGLLDVLEPMGYSIYSLCAGAGTLIPFRRDRPIDSFQINLFACTPNRAAKLRARGILFDLPETEPTPADYDDNAVAAPALFRPRSDAYPLDRSYAGALAHYIEATRARSSRDRYTHLRQAFHLATRARGERLTAARSLTHAQIARALGFRATAVSNLLEIAQVWANEPNPMVDEPCLCPGDVANNRVTEEPTGLKVAALEAFERWRVFSSIYTGPSALPLIDHICSLPGSSPEFHRRAQLLRIAYTTTPHPPPHPVLLIESPDNLNAWFWQARVSQKR